MMFGKRRKPFDPAMIDKTALAQGPSFNPMETPMGQALPDYMQMSANAPKVGQRFLDKPIVRTAMGTIGDLLLQNSGFDPVYAPQVKDQRRQSLLQQQQKAENAQWYEREQWKARQTEPTALQRNYEYISGMDKDLGQSYLRTQAEPVKFVTMADGSMRPVPTSTGPTPGAVDHLRKNPTLAADFDAKYGAGASQRYLQGGPAAPQPGGFPR